MLYRRLLPVLILTVFIIPIAVAAAEGDELQLVTKSPVGLKEDKTLVKLGMTASEVEKQFGPPERKNEEFRTWSYVNDGITIRFTPEQKVATITAYYNNKNGVKVSKAKTDTGLGEGSSYRKIVAAHGQPTSRGKWKNVENLTVYKLGEGEFLSFFGDELFAISLSAEDPRNSAD